MTKTIRYEQPKWVSSIGWLSFINSVRSYLEGARSRAAAPLPPECLPSGHVQLGIDPEVNPALPYISLLTSESPWRSWKVLIGRIRCLELKYNGWIAGWIADLEDQNVTWSLFLLCFFVLAVWISFLFFFYPCVFASSVLDCTLDLPLLFWFYLPGFWTDLLDFDPCLPLTVSLLLHYKKKKQTNKQIELIQHCLLCLEQSLKNDYEGGGVLYPAGQRLKYKYLHVHIFWNSWWGRGGHRCHFKDFNVTTVLYFYFETKYVGHIT